jgi:hypothetical protein
MPDVRSMSGMSMPAPELADGTVTVRVVRGDMSNNLAGVSVELHGAGAERRATTGTDGRAEFAGVPPGATVHVHTVVDGQSLDSRPFQMPDKGGVRTLLAADGDAPPPAGGAPAQGGPVSGSGAAAPASPGNGPSLSIGGNSRIAAEFSEDVLQVFYILEIVNRTSQPISPESALVFDMPTGASGATVLEGSTKNANARGTRVTVTGPFPPGTTPLQIAFRLDTIGSGGTITSRFPLPVDVVSVAVQKVGDMTVSSPQVSQLRDRPIEAALFAMGIAPRLEAGSPLVLQLANVPHHSRAPIYMALAIALAILGGAVWFLVFPGPLEAVDARRKALQERREKGLASLAALEQAHRAGRIDDAEYGERRGRLVAQLERVYGELDAEGGAGGQGVAA